MSTERFQEAAEKYHPAKIRFLFIAESPPHVKEGVEPRYFYFEEYRGKDFLFRAIAEVLYPDEFDEFKKSGDKKALLGKLSENGFFLIDACDYPINQHKDRDRFVNKDFPNLTEKIRRLVDGETKIILIKKNIYDLLFDRLRSEGFNVINSEHLDFPSCGNQLKFKEKLKRLLAGQNTKKS
jgi:hypothetical protein